MPTGKGEPAVPGAGTEHALGRWSGDLRRSRVETKMNCMKLLGQKLMSRDFDRQTAELQVRIAILNRFTALGIPVTQPVR